MPLLPQQRFSRTRASVSAAREFALTTLVEWNIDDRQDDIRLCVSELATNALLHGVPPGREFCVRLLLEGAVLRLEVRDSGDGRPEVRHPDTERCTGRGLFLVGELADDFGVVQHVPGKTVWAVFKVTTRPGGDSGESGYRQADSSDGDGGGSGSTPVPIGRGCDAGTRKLRAACASRPVPRPPCRRRGSRCTRPCRGLR